MGEVYRARDTTLKRDVAIKVLPVTVQQATNPGHVLGTVGYMSPEQVRGKPADAGSDIFALGVILYEMVTGKPAFRKETSAETMSAILKEEPPPISQYSSITPPGSQRVISRCLTKNPEQRFQHASDVGFALEALSDTSTGPVAIGQTAKRPGERSLLWIASAVAVASLAALVFYLRPTGFLVGPRSQVQTSTVEIDRVDEVLFCCEILEPCISPIESWR